MRDIFNKLKNFFNQKEKRQDILYILAMILIVGIIAVLFIWSMSIVYRAMDAAFFINQKDISEDISKFDFDEFKKIAPRLKIDFDISQSQDVSVPLEPIQPIITEEDTTAVQEIPVDILLVNLEILNGTAVKGLAADWKNKFVSAGFSETGIKTGNADNKNYSGVTVYHNSGEKTLEKITGVFSQNNISVKAEIDLKLNDNSFIIIIGK